MVVLGVEYVICYSESRDLFLRKENIMYVTMSVSKGTKSCTIIMQVYLCLGVLVMEF